MEEKNKEKINEEVKENKIQTITFDYNGHDNIQTKISYLNKGVLKTIVSDIIMKIEDNIDNKYFDNEKVKSVDAGLFSNFKSIYYYDRTTISLESDETRKKKLVEVFKGNKSIKNALFICSGEQIDIIENIDTKDIQFKITNKTSKSKNNFDNFKDIFYSSNISENELDIINSIRFSYAAYPIANDIVDKVSKQIALKIIKETPDIFDTKLTIDDIPRLGASIANYYSNKYLNTNLNISLGSKDFYDTYFEDVAKYDLNVSSSNEFVKEVLNKKNIRSLDNFKRLLESDICSDASISNVPLKNEVDRLLKIRLDTLLINQTENHDINKISEMYKDNNYGFICTQDSKNELVNRNAYRLEVDKENLNQSLKASMSNVCDGLNKIIDLRNINELDHREKIFKTINTNSKNFTILTKNIGDVSFLMSAVKNGNFYKLDNRYLGNETDESVFIVDIAEFGYFTDLSLKNLIDINHDRLNKRIIELPEYNQNNNLVKNVFDLKISMIDKLITQRDFSPKNIVKVDSLYKFNELIRENLKDFDIFDINKEYKIIKQADEFYKFAKENIGMFFTSNLPTIFSSFTVNKEKKIFNNGFYYNNRGSSVSVKDIEQTPPLLSYISRTPNGEIISKIAKKFNVDIDVEKPFSLTNLEQNKLNIGKKEIVTTSKRGAIDFAFPPKTFTLEDKEKEEFVDIVKTILKTNQAMSEERINDEVAELNKLLEDSSYLMMKNEQTIIDTSKFAPKEILVLLDENLNDLAKLNIPISDFYDELKQRKIYDINDYIEIAKPNSIFLEKLSTGLSAMISDFRKQHEENIGVTKEEIDSLLNKKIIKVGEDRVISPSDLLLTKGNLNYKNKLFKDLGNKVGILDYYKSFIEIEDSNKIFTWLDKQDLPKSSKANIERVLKEKFIGNEILFIEQHSSALFTYIQKNIPEDNTTLFSQIETKLFDIYHNKKLEDSIVSKTMKLYSLENALNKVLADLHSIDNTLGKKELFQEKLKHSSRLKTLIDLFAYDISGLRPHQYEEALNYAVLKNLDVKDTQMSFLEMRGGKTGIAIFTQLFLALTGNNKDDLTHNFFVQNSNMNDIANQTIEFCPILAKDISFISSDKISIFKNEKSIELPVSIAKQITPHIIQMVKPIINFKGEKKSLKSDTVILANTYTTEMNQIHKQLQYYTQDDLLNMYKNSPFIDILKLAGKRKVDKDIANAVRQSFVYIQMIYEKKYIAAEDSSYVFEKMSEFVEKSIASKEQLKANNLSKKGIVLIPKNLLYSINVDSPITNINIEKKDSERKMGNAKLQTPYEISTKVVSENQLSNIFDAKQQENIMDILKCSIGVPNQIKEYNKQGVVFKVSKTLSDAEILREKETISRNYLYSNLNNASEDVKAIMDSYITSSTKDFSLASSPIYKLEGLDEQLKDTLQVELSVIFSHENLEEFLKDYSQISKEDKEKIIETLSSNQNQLDFASKSNELYFNNIVYNLYNTSLAGTTAKRVENISPLLAKKYKDLLYSFKVDLELIDDKLPLPLRKQKIDTRYIYFIDMVEMEHNALDLNNLTTPAKKDLKGLQLELGYSQSSPIFRVKREQNPDLLLEMIVKRNEALNNKYIVDISPNKTIMSFDEAHKGLKTKSSSLTIHDSISYLHKTALYNKGSVSIMSGTPTSGLAEETGKIMSTGLDSAQSALITKSIDMYCTTYEFRDNLDAIIISSLEAFPGGKVERALEKILLVKNGDTDKEKYKLSEDEIESLKEELQTIVKNIPNLDITQKDELLKTRLKTSSLQEKFNFFRTLFKVEEQLEKVENNPKYKIKITDLKQLLLSQIHHLTKKVPGINNYSTLASILLKMGSKNSINITRASENREYNIIDDEILKKQYDARDIKERVSVDVTKFKDKTLALSAYCDAYRRVLKLTDIKEKVSEIFESWVIDIFSSNNREKAINMFGLKSKYKEEDINSLISRTGKTVKDSVSDIFNVLYFGSENEKYELSENKAVKDKVALVLDIIERFNEFTDKYYYFQNEARNLYTNELEQSKIEDREIKEVYITKNGFKFDASKYHHLSPDLGKIHLFEKNPSNETENVITLSNLGDVLLNNNPIVFKTSIKANNWSEITKDGVELKYSLTNPLETEIMEYLASDSHTLYKEHLDKGENIRIMSARSASLVISFFDALKALVNREDKDKKAVLILNKNSSKDYNFSKIINSLNLEVLEKANIDIKVTKSTIFQNVLDEVSKNKNNQICVVGNYGALAEGFNMVCINAAFYVSSTPNGQLTIQSFARDTNAKKEISNLYLCNNGLINKYTIDNRIKPEYFTNPNSDTYNITRDIFNNSIKIEDDNSLDIYEPLNRFNYCKITPTIVMTANSSKVKVEAYTAVMSGNYPKEKINYENKNLFSLSDFKLNKNIDVDTEQPIEIENDNTEEIVINAEINQ